MKAKQLSATLFIITSCFMCSSSCDSPSNSNTANNRLSMSIAIVNDKVECNLLWSERGEQMILLHPWLNLTIVYYDSQGMELLNEEHVIYIDSAFQDMNMKQISRYLDINLEIDADYIEVYFGGGSTIIRDRIKLKT